MSQKSNFISIYYQISYICYQIITLLSGITTLFVKIKKTNRKKNNKNTYISLRVNKNKD